MATKHDLADWVHDALKDSGGSARLVDVAKKIWNNHEIELKASGDLFFTWQYDMRWAANLLRRSGIMKASEDSPNGVWELKK
ncbi:hypothetical protein IVG45_16620 [Methylomonas sp. LL1]|uniref:hypothetical protein n=1 Tax=Methylomonas sp. LL1 TaxID=2785785 RepID=UPI0018C37549|nr:hypothetical protein [Methylomonas sp. LL1]QPK62461.1 hypothetical protein IVG45_16620 [Methylomonas sp. LL1]